MKILFITNNFPPIVDGVGDYTYNIAKQFAENNHEVYVICRDSINITKDNIGITVFPIIKKWDYSCYKPIITLIKEKSIDIVSLQYVPHGFHYKGLPFSLIKLSEEIKACNTKLFTFFHEVSVEKINKNLKQTFLSILMQYISKKIINKSDYVATSIDYYRDMIYNLVPVKHIKIIPICSNIPETKISEKELFEFKKGIVPNNETLISFFGIRNFQTSIDAISELKNDGYKIKIMLIGKTQKKQIKNIPMDTIITGTLNIEAVDKYLKVSDFFILPQDNIYGCSFKSGSLAAGLRNGLPIITAKGKMTSDLLVNGKNIMFTDFESKDKVKESILFLLSNKDKASFIGRQAYEVSKNFTWNETYKKYIEILQ